MIIVRGIYSEFEGEKLDIRLGGYFDEEILSGSQGEGFAGRNETFPHTTASNCKKCSSLFVENIKTFNTSYNIEDLEKMVNCDVCYHIWECTYNVRDSRSIPERIVDILGNK